LGTCGEHAVLYQNAAPKVCIFVCWWIRKSRRKVKEEGGNGKAMKGEVATTQHWIDESVA
jgi:O-glycosyl hydrolase